MARLAVLASGEGSNFEAIVLALRVAAGRPGAPTHECVLLVHDRPRAPAAERARRLGVPSLHLDYRGLGREGAEAALGEALDAAGADLVALAGFMRLLSPAFARARAGRIVNVHPSLLPAWPGAGAIRRAFEAGERRFGVTVHFVDEGMDTGPRIDKAEFTADPGEGLEAIEERVHRLEHGLYPRILLAILDGLEEGRALR